MSPTDSTIRPNGLLLVVEDEPSMAAYLHLVLERGGYAVATASEAEGAWALFQREAPQVRAVVTDLRMPGGWDGLELARRVREAAPTTPVLLVTGHACPEPLGPNCSLLAKPFSPEALRAAVRRALEARGGLVDADAGAGPSAGRHGEPHPDRRPTATGAVSTDQPRDPA
jgi:CheY-like chemotaxis protein